jgi:hypothetical protein
MRLRRVDGVWRAELEVHAELATEDVPVAVGHELDESAGFLIRNPTARTGAEAMDAPASATQAVVFRPDSTANTPSDHDFASVRELVRHFEEYRRLQEMRGRDALITRDQRARIHRLLESMGLARPLTEGTPGVNDRFWDRAQALDQALRDLVVDEAVRQDLTAFVEHQDTRAAVRNNFGRDIALSDLAGAQPTMARAEPGHWQSHKPATWTIEQFARAILDVLNNPTHAFTGTYRTGRSVDIYYQATDPAGRPRSRVVVTELGQKDRVITAYGEFEAGQDPVPVERWTVPRPGEVYSAVPVWWGRYRVR